MRITCAFVPVVVVLAMTARTLAETNVESSGKRIEAPVPKYDASEKVVPRASLSKSVEYLDNLAAFWMEEKVNVDISRRHARGAKLTSCGACHANFSYLMVRPLLLKDFPRSQVPETRRWMEEKIARRFKELNFERPYVGPVFFHHDGTAEGYSALEFVGNTTALVFHDAQTSGKLQPLTRSALTKMWALQNKDSERGYAGTWNMMDHCGGTFPIVEFDQYYGATLAALATGVAPDGYASSPEAKEGLARLRTYFKKHPPSSLHHQAMLLWASLRTEGLMTPAERTATIDKLLKLQGADGGWSTRALLERDGAGRFQSTASDGYGTGFAVFMLRQAGVAASRDELVRGVNWLKTQQRASGVWFTPYRRGHDETEGGLGTRGLSMTALSTAFAVMALQACEEAGAVAEKKVP
jgi:squalene-hopene/tetraprenyl-beta-curcumene cyclase